MFRTDCVRRVGIENRTFGCMAYGPSLFPTPPLSRCLLRALGLHAFEGGKRASNPRRRTRAISRCGEDGEWAFASAVSSPRSYYGARDARSNATPGSQRRGGSILLPNRGAGNEPHAMPGCPVLWVIFAIGCYLSDLFRSISCILRCSVQSCSVLFCKSP